MNSAVGYTSPERRVVEDREEENEDESTEPISAGKEDEEKTTKNDLRRRLEKK